MLRKLASSRVGKLQGFVALACFLSAIFAANQTYFFCRMTGELQTNCCCSSNDQTDDEESSINTNCCEVRTNDAPSEGVRAAASPVVFFDAAVAPPLGGPIAIVARCSDHASRTRDILSTGPPLDPRLARIPVLLL